LTDWVGALAAATPRANVLVFAMTSSGFPHAMIGRDAPIPPDGQNQVKRGHAFLDGAEPATLVSLRGDAMDLLQLRVIERVLAVVIGGLSIYLGYRLFIKLPKQKDSSGKVMLPGDISIFFSRVGPGVFFSLFGAAVVVVSLQHGLELDLANKASVTGDSTEKTANLKVRYMGGGTGEFDPAKRDALRAEARRTIAELNKLPTLLAVGVPASRRTDVAQAIRDSKLALVGMVWGADWGDFSKFRNWVNDGETDSVPPGIAPEAVTTFRQARE
jgi:hypothetical protein